MRKRRIHHTHDTVERAFLVGINRPDSLSVWTMEDSLEELQELARTAGVRVVGKSSQRIKEIHPGTLIGAGKIEEIKAAAGAGGAQLIIFDEELAPGQQKNLEKYFGQEFSILDRTALILDIFAQHARTKEGQLQVELAQYEYRLPRLTRLWTHLARQAGGRVGGVGLRGPGETQLEIDRRTIRKRISSLKREIARVRLHREQQRQKRKNEGFFVVALAGYTNAGKSTLLNQLSNADVLVENKLFSTLDPTTRRVRLPGGLNLLVTDTVGFITKLPHDLVAAFRATFEEIGEADLILLIVDASHPHALLQRGVVERELAASSSVPIPVIPVWNKIDKLKPEKLRSLSDFNGEFAVSAKTGKGILPLLQELDKICSRDLVGVTARIPYSEGRLLSLIHNAGVVLETSHEDSATVVKALVPMMLKKMIGSFHV